MIIFCMFSRGFYRTWKSSENQVLIGLEGSLLAAIRVDTAPPESFALSFSIAVDGKVKLRKSVVSSHHKSSACGLDGPEDVGTNVGQGDLAATDVQTFCKHFVRQGKIM